MTEAPLFPIKPPLHFSPSPFIPAICNYTDILHKPQKQSAGEKAAAPAFYTVVSVSTLGWRIPRLTRSTMQR